MTKDEGMSKNLKSKIRDQKSETTDY